MAPLTANSISAVQPRASDLFSTYGQDIEVRSGQTVVVEFFVASTSDIKPTVLGAKMIEIQEIAPGSSTWKIVATYTSERNPDFLGYDVFIYSGEVQYQGRISCLYRAKITYTCTKNGKTGTKELTTDNVMAK